MACSTVRSNQGLSYHFTALAREFRYLARWNMHHTPSVIPFIQINCVRLNPAMYFPANQSPGLWTLANDSLLPTLMLSHGRAKKCLQGGYNSHPMADWWETVPNTLFRHLKSTNMSPSIYHQLISHVLSNAWIKDAGLLDTWLEVTPCRFSADFTKSFKGNSGKSSSSGSKPFPSSFEAPTGQGQRHCWMHSSCQPDFLLPHSYH